MNTCMYVNLLPSKGDVCYSVFSRNKNTLTIPVQIRGFPVVLW